MVVTKDQLMDRILAQKTFKNENERRRYLHRLFHTSKADLENLCKALERKNRK